MGKGRITKIEQVYRIRMLLRFIFIFRYATREELFKFGQDRLKLSYPRWLIDYSVKQGFIATYHEPAISLKVYYLTQRGKECISKYEPFSSYYRFDNKNTGLNTLEHQKAVIESYFSIYRQLEIKDWIPEWVIRKDRKTRDKIPDNVIVASSGIKIALEVETWYKKKSAWEVVVYKYSREISYNIPEHSRYDVVLIVASSSYNYDGIKERLFYIKPEFSKRAFILADVLSLDIGTCFYQDEYMSLKEALRLVCERKNSSHDK
ncbi:MAG: hypothetical protein KJ661_04055 [Candidatus Omnitrophica bacterium]|nr:hypothetical protein [Candidatus Omnitrophota bacterium]